MLSQPASAALRTEGASIQIDDADHGQIVERLRWTPRQRLAYLVDMVAFEERAHRARQRWNLLQEIRKRDG